MPPQSNTIFYVSLSLILLLIPLIQIFYYILCFTFFKYIKRDNLLMYYKLTNEF